MKLTAKPSDDIRALIAAEIATAETAVTAGVRAAAAGLKDRWRGQITAAGLGPRLARTIRQQDFPASEPSLRAASLVYSRAATIVHAFDQGVTIRSKHGFFLAIPLPAAGAKELGNTRITPGGWGEARSAQWMRWSSGPSQGTNARSASGGLGTGQRLRFVYRRGAPSLLVADDARIDARGRATAKRGRRRRDGILTGAQTVPVFLLAPQVRLKKRIDIDGAAAAWLARLPGLIPAHWSETPDRG